MLISPLTLWCSPFVKMPSEMAPLALPKSAPPSSPHTPCIAGISMDAHAIVLAAIAVDNGIAAEQADAVAAGAHRDHMHQSIQWHA